MGVSCRDCQLSSNRLELRDSSWCRSRSSQHHSDPLMIPSLEARTPPHSGAMPPIPPPRAHGFTTTTPVPLYWAEYGDLPTRRRCCCCTAVRRASHEYLLPQMLALAEEHRVVTYDQRGGGRSRHDDDRAVIGWHDQVADVARVVAELRVEPLTIVGYSWGGLLAMLYAVEAAAGRVAPAPARLALIDPAPITRPARQAVRAGVRAPAGRPRSRRAARRARRRPAFASAIRTPIASAPSSSASPATSPTRRAPATSPPSASPAACSSPSGQSLGDYDLRALARDGARADTRSTRSAGPDPARVVRGGGACPRHDVRRH